jgi:hypothetical protein
LDIGKDTNLNFKIWVIEKLWKYKIEPGPLVSHTAQSNSVSWPVRTDTRAVTPWWLSHCLPPGADADGRRLPPASRHPRVSCCPSISLPRPREEAKLMPLLWSQHHLCSVSPPLVRHLCLAPLPYSSRQRVQRRFLRSRAPKLFSKSCSDLVPGRQEPKPTPSPLPPQAPPRHWTPPTVPGPPWPHTELHAAKEFLPDHSNPVGDHHSGLPTFFPHHQFPLSWTSPPGEPPPLRYPKSVLPPCWLAPRTLSATPSYRQSPDSSWPSPPGEAQRLPLFSPSGRKCRVGRATSLAGWAVSLLAGAVHCNSGVSLLYFELIQNSLQI